MIDRTDTINSLNRLRSIVRAYDIRGIVPDALDEKDSFILGCILGLYVKRLVKEFLVIIGTDNRKSSFTLSSALCAGFATCNIVTENIGIIPTPVLYYNSFVSNFDKKTLGIMVTASHNPPEFNGFKIVFDSKIVDGTELRKAIDDYHENLFSISNAKKNDYVEYILKTTKLNEIQHNTRKKILWDCNNGSTVEILNEITHNLSAENYIINTEKELATQPDPTHSVNIDRIKRVVADYDIAFCLDGDGDRLVIMMKDGSVLRGDKILLILAKYLHQSVENNTIVVDIKTSNLITDELEKMGFQTIVQKTGHSFIKSMMLKTNASLGGEVSGHLFFPFSNAKSSYIPYDDAILAACYCLKIFLSEEDFIERVISSLPKTFCSYDIKIACQKYEQQTFLEYLTTNLKKNQMPYNDIDGVKYCDNDGWWLIRASNTEDVLIICIESKTAQGYAKHSNFIIGILQIFNLNADAVPKMYA